MVHHPSYCPASLPCGDEILLEDDLLVRREFEFPPLCPRVEPDLMHPHFDMTWLKTRRAESWREPNRSRDLGATCQEQWRKWPLEGRKLVLLAEVAQEGIFRF